MDVEYYLYTETSTQGWGVMDVMGWGAMDVGSNCIDQMVLGPIPTAYQ